MEIIPICSVTYNRKIAVKQWIENLLTSLDKEYEYELHIHDNASKDGTYEMLRGLVVSANLDNSPLKFIRIYKSEKNIGKPKALNGLFKLLNPDFKYVISSDSDIILKPGWATALMSAVKDNPKLGLVSPLYKKNNNNPVLGYDIIDKLKEERDLFYFQKDLGHNIAGGFIMLSVEALNKVEGYTEVGVYGGNDAKLNVKLVNAGYECAYTSRAYIEHIVPIKEYGQYETWKRDIQKKMHREGQFHENKGFWD